jgi:hypothetical protein
MEVPNPSLQRPMSAPCAICELHGDRIRREACEIGRGQHWLLRHHPDPAPLVGWLLLDARSHLAGPLAFTDQQALAWGPAVRHDCRRVQRLCGCERVDAIAFGEGASYRDVVAGARPPADPDRMRELAEQTLLDGEGGV